MAKHTPAPALATDQDLEQLTSLFKLLSDKTRLQILTLLAQGERNVTSLCEELNLPQPTVSHHLGLLRMTNVVGHRRDGKQVIYGLAGRGTSGKDHVLELPVHHLVVRILPKVKP
jgi:ArsR family transcriptional regulator, zinc-responsive transcriptional repressor